MCLAKTFGKLVKLRKVDVRNVIMSEILSLATPVGCCNSQS